MTFDMKYEMKTRKEKEKYLYSSSKVAARYTMYDTKIALCMHAHAGTSSRCKPHMYNTCTFNYAPLHPQLRLLCGAGSY